MSSDHSPSYYDTFGGQLLIGANAVDVHIEAGGHPADIVPLSDLLSQNAIDLSTEPTKQNVRKWGKPEFIANGRWLENIVTEPVDPRRKKIS